MKFILPLFLLINVFTANAQWPDNKSYTYDFGTKTGTFDKLGGYTTSSKSKNSFLPEATSGTVRISIHPLSENGSFLLTGNNSLEFTQPKSRPLKFTNYGIGLATDVVYTSYKISFNKNEVATSAGAYTWAIGNNKLDNSASIFTNTGNSLYRSSPEIFAALRWSLSEASTVTFSYRVGSDAAKTTTYKTIDKTTFAQGNTYQIEVYCNNSVTEQIYTRNKNSFKLAANTYHVWANDLKLGGDLPRSIEVDGEDGLTGATSIALANKTPLNSYAFIADGAAKANGKLTISDLSMSYK